MTITLRQTKGFALTWPELDGNFTHLQNSVPISVKNFGAVGDGVTDDILAIRAADAALVALGGGILFFPPGTYLTSLRYQPSSNVNVFGSGIGATKIKNAGLLSPDNIAIDIRGTLSGTTYAINAPTEGANTVTTTTAGDAGNFSTNDYIAIHGSLIGNDYIPFWITKVSTAVAGTGVITLTERLLRGGATITHVQKVTSLKENISIQNLSISQSSDVGLIVKYAKNVLISSVDASVGITSAGIVIIASREVTVQRSRSYANLGVHSCTNARIVDNSLALSLIIFEGGCEGGLVSLNEILTPMLAAGIYIGTRSQRIQIIHNAIEVMGGTVDGIQVTGGGSNEGENLIAFNKISGGNGGSNGITVGGVRSDNNIIAFNHIRDIPFGIRINTNSAGQRLSGNEFASTVTTQYAIDGGGTVKSFDMFGAGAPAFAAVKGSAYYRSDGSSSSTRAYVNTDGGTGWTSITTAT